MQIEALELIWPHTLPNKRQHVHNAHWNTIGPFGATQTLIRTLNSHSLITNSLVTDVMLQRSLLSSSRDWRRSSPDTDSWQGVVLELRYRAGGWQLLSLGNWPVTRSRAEPRTWQPLVDTKINLCAPWKISKFFKKHCICESEKRHSKRWRKDGQVKEGARRPMLYLFPSLRLSRTAGHQIVQP
jgi:hypothetical protein